MFEALVVVVNVEDQFVLEVDQLVLVVHGFYFFFPLLFEQSHFFSLKVVDCLSYTLHSRECTLTNSMKIYPLSWSLMTYASWLMNLKMSEGNIEMRSAPSLRISS